MRNLLLIPFFALIAAASFAADKDVEDLLTKMRNTYKNVKSAKFVMEGTLNTEGGAIPVTVSGKYLQPNLLKVEITTPGESASLVCDGANIAMRSPGMDPAKRPYTLDNLGQAMPANLEVLCFFDWKRQLSTAKGDNMAESKLSLKKGVKWNGQNWLVLEEEAPQVGVYVEYYIDADSNLIHRTVVKELKSRKQLAEHKLKSVELGAKAEKSEFKIG